MHKFLCGHVSFLLGRYLGVELMGHSITPCLTFWGTTRLFSEATVTFYIPISSIGGSQPLHSLTNTCYCVSFYWAILVAVRWYVTGVLIGNSRMANDTGHLLCAYEQMCFPSQIFRILCILSNFTLPSQFSSLSSHPLIPSSVLACLSSWGLDDHPLTHGRQALQSL